MTHPPKAIEFIARGVLVHEGHLLLCHSKGAANTYLPGGHIEFGEGACASLAREIQEELGRKAEVGWFLGAIEHTYERKGAPQCEVNLVFEYSIPGLTTAEAPGACEEEIEFQWCALGELDASGLEPWPLRRLIPEWAAGRDVGAWASTY